MGRPKIKIERKTIRTTLKIELLNKLRTISDESGIPINKLLELSLEKSLESIKLEIK